MSFSKINPAGWSNGDKVTSAQLNQLDADHANSLDKSAAGDILGGTITFSGPNVGEINANQTGAIVATAEGGIVSDIGAGIASLVPGGIYLSGGSSDEITYTGGRTYTVALMCEPMQGYVSTGWQAANGEFVGSATNNLTSIGPWRCHQGATLTNIRVYIQPATGHTAVPAALPELRVYRYDLTLNTSLIIGDTTASAASAAAWNTTTYWDIPCNLGGAGANVIDRTRYLYSAGLIDEYGSGSLTGNHYWGLVLTFSSIPNMAFA